MFDKIFERIYKLSWLLLALVGLTLLWQYGDSGRYTVIQNGNFSRNFIIVLDTRTGKLLARSISSNSEPGKQFHIHTVSAWE